ncbi:MAG: 4Fe-4S dicluster domain-containing protein [Thermodesulfobacteriota bacterium]|nr:4Fe-4S dicluster domain-containing protein [bacterium]
MRYGMVIDLKKCIGCYGCQISCKAENATPPGVLWARVMKREFGKYPNTRRLSLPLLCMHCQDPACETVCPTKATTKGDSGIVTVDQDKCVGCRYCMMVCPYQARYHHAKEREYFPGQGLTPFEEMGYKQHKPGLVSKCNFCQSRLEQGLEPSCVVTCMCKARYFGDLDDPESEVSRLIRDRAGYQLHPELGTDPSVYYLAP